ncbi:hypothetical protein GC176_02575 [bacterium]|nr:hypothetical protein [bacterium]
MTRTPFVIPVALLLLATSLQAQDVPQRGKIREISKDAVVITVEGKDITCAITPDTRWMSAANRPIRQPIADNGVKAGAAVMFLARERDGEQVLIGLKLVGEDSGRADGQQTGPLTERGEIRRGKIATLDVDQRVVTMTVDGNDEKFELTEDAIVLGATGGNLRERFSGIKAGADVFFKVALRGEKSVVVAFKPADSTPARPSLPKVESDNLVPLTALGQKEYQGFEGGLYPGGTNERPAAHEAAGLALARTVQPLDLEGNAAADGSIVLLSVGMSNTAQISMGFNKALANERHRNPHVVFVNGAQGGMTAAAIQDPEDNGRGTQYWTVVDERLKAAGVTRAQVQVVWIKQADAGPTQGFPDYAQKLQEELTRIVQLLPQRFPNVKLVYLSSRTYGGFAETRLNPEPYAYESGFSVKWLIEEQLKGEPALNFDGAKGPVKAQWLSWGPYLWDNGVIPRADGYQPVEKLTWRASAGTVLFADGMVREEP